MNLSDIIYIFKCQWGVVEYPRVVEAEWYILGVF